MVCPVFAALPQEQQLEAFEPAPAGTRKFVLVSFFCLLVPGMYFCVFFVNFVCWYFCDFVFLCFCFFVYSAFCSFECCFSVCARCCMDFFGFRSVFSGFYSVSIFFVRLCFLLLLLLLFSTFVLFCFVFCSTEEAITIIWVVFLSLCGRKQHVLFVCSCVELFCFSTLRCCAVLFFFRILSANKNCLINSYQVCIN